MFADKMAAPNKGVIKAVVSCDTIIVMGVPQVHSGHLRWRKQMLEPATFWLERRLSS